MKQVGRNCNVSHQTARNHLNELQQRLMDSDTNTCHLWVSGQVTVYIQSTPTYLYDCFVCVYSLGCDLQLTGVHLHLHCFISANLQFMDNTPIHKVSALNLVVCRCSITVSFKNFIHIGPAGSWQSFVNSVNKNSELTQTGGAPMLPSAIFESTVELKFLLQPVS